MAPNRLEEALLVDTLDEVVGQHVEKLGQLQAIPSRKNFFLLILKEIFHEKCIISPTHCPVHI